jgi:hypothetical protein
VATMTKQLLLNPGRVITMELGPSILRLVTGDKTLAIFSVRHTQFDNWIWLRGVSFGWHRPPVKFLAKFIFLNERR